MVLRTLLSELYIHSSILLSISQDGLLGAKNTAKEQDRRDSFSNGTCSLVGEIRQ